MIVRFVGSGRRERQEYDGEKGVHRFHVSEISTGAWVTKDLFPLAQSRMSDAQNKNRPG
jgi:hypothetical protein